MMISSLVQSLGLFVVYVHKAMATVMTTFQVQRLTAIAAIGLILLTTSVDNSSLNANTKATLNEMISRGENGRPVTTAQWQAENRRLQGKPSKQAERITKEAADAVGEMAEIYPENVKSVLPGMSNDSLERDD